MKPLITIIIAFLFFQVAAVTADNVNVKKLMNRNWVQVESEHFSALSEAGDKKTIAMLQELEDFNYFMSDHLGYQQKPLEHKVPVILAKSGGTFRALGMPRNYVGIFSPSGKFFFARADRFRSSAKGSANWGRSVVLHELVHLLISGQSYKMATPPWYNEGIAEYFGTFKQENNSVVLGDMSVLGDRFYSILSSTGQKFESVDTEALFKVTQEELKVGSGNGRKHKKMLEKFYARSAAVVHYLNADRARRKQMHVYLVLLKRGYTVDKGFEAAFKATYAELDKAVDEYVSGRWMMSRVFPIGTQAGMVNFPIVKTETIEITNRDAMGFIYDRLVYFSDQFLGEGARDKMNADFERLIPGFFEN